MNLNQLQIDIEKIVDDSINTFLKNNHELIEILTDDLNINNHQLVINKMIKYPDGNLSSPKKDGDTITTIFNGWKLVRFNVSANNDLSNFPTKMFVWNGRDASDGVAILDINSSSFVNDLNNRLSPIGFQAEKDSDEDIVLLKITADKSPLEMEGKIKLTIECRFRVKLRSTERHEDIKHFSETTEQDILSAIKEMEDEDDCTYLYNNLSYVPGSVLMISPSGTIIDATEYEIHSNFAETLCSAKFIRDVNELDYLQEVLGFVTLNSGIVEAEWRRKIVLPPSETRITSIQSRIIKEWLGEESKIKSTNTNPNVYVYICGESSQTYDIRMYSPNDILKKINKGYMTGILEEDLKKHIMSGGEFEKLIQSNIKQAITDLLTKNKDNAYYITNYLGGNLQSCVEELTDFIDCRVTNVKRDGRFLKAHILVYSDMKFTNNGDKNWIELGFNNNQTDEGSILGVEEIFERKNPNIQLHYDDDCFEFRKRFNGYLYLYLEFELWYRFDDEEMSELPQKNFSTTNEQDILDALKQLESDERKKYVFDDLDDVEGTVLLVSPSGKIIDATEYSMHTSFMDALCIDYFVRDVDALDYAQEKLGFITLNSGLVEMEDRCKIVLPQDRITYKQQRILEEWIAKQQKLKYKDGIYIYGYSGGYTNLALQLYSPEKFVNIINHYYITRTFDEVWD